MNPTPTGPENAPPTPSPEGPSTGETVMAELASDVVAPVAPVSSAVRADVKGLAAFLRGIHSGYLLVGIGLYVLTAVAGTIVVVTRGFSDWYMHLAMQVILFAFVLLYVRAHQLGRKVVRGIYAVLTLALLGFYAWILVDLVPQRLDVLSGRPRPDGLTGPEVVMRPSAEALYLVVAGLGVVIVWLVAHWLVLGRFRSEAHERVS
ncbi:MAG: hypothetical protein U1F43_36995 [Myxococcota bacterium]